MARNHQHWWVWSGPAEGLAGYEYCHGCGVLPPLIEVDAFPVSRQGHVDGHDCACRPYRDTENAAVLVHRKLVAA